MKKKIMAMCLVIAMAATAVIGGTLAYFTDTDEAVNVMTMGNVAIEQNEYQRNEKGDELVKFVDDKPLMPAVYTNEEFAKTADFVIDNEDNIADKNFTLRNEIGNIIDKVVTVKNTADANAINQDVYARTLFAFETKTSYNPDGTVHTEAKKVFNDYIATFGLGDSRFLTMDTILVNGVEYVVAEYVYENALKPQEESAPSLKQLFLAPTANNEVMNLFGKEYNVLVLSQATQTAGFDNAVEALDTAFGDVETATNPETGNLLVQEWFAALNPANN